MTAVRRRSTPTRGNRGPDDANNNMEVASETSSTHSDDSITYINDETTMSIGSTSSNSNIIIEQTIHSSNTAGNDESQKAAEKRKKRKLKRDPSPIIANQREPLIAQKKVTLPAPKKLGVPLATNDKSQTPEPPKRRPTTITRRSLGPSSPGNFMNQSLTASVTLSPMNFNKRPTTRTFNMDQQEVSTIQQQQQLSSSPTYQHQQITHQTTGTAGKKEERRSSSVTELRQNRENNSSRRDADDLQEILIEEFSKYEGVKDLQRKSSKPTIEVQQQQQHHHQQQKTTLPLINSNGVTTYNGSETLTSAQVIQVLKDESRFAHPPAPKFMITNPTSQGVKNNTGIPATTVHIASSSIGSTSTNNNSSGITVHKPERPATPKSNRLNIFNSTILKTDLETRQTKPKSDKRPKSMGGDLKQALEKDSMFARNTISSDHMTELREKIESGKYISMTQMFPSKVDRKGRPIKFQSDRDSNMSIVQINKELKSVTREVELLHTAIANTTQAVKDPRGISLPSANSEINLSKQLDTLEKRRKRLKYYKKLMSVGLQAWNAYRLERDIIIPRSLNDTHVQDSYSSVEDENEIQENLEINIQRYDSEFRRWTARQSGSLPISPKMHQAIISVNPESTAQNVIDRLMDQMRESGKKKKIDEQMEKEKLTEEIRRWQRRWSSLSSSGVTSSSDVGSSVGSSTLSFSSASIYSSSSVSDSIVSDDIELGDDPSDVSPSARGRSSSGMLSSLSISQSISQSISIGIGKDIYDVEVIIVNDLDPFGTADSGFFLTASETDDASDEEEDGRDNARELLGQMIEKYKPFTDKYKRPAATANNNGNNDKTSPSGPKKKEAEDEDVKFFQKIDVQETRNRSGSRRYSIKQITDDPRLPVNDRHNQSFEDFMPFMNNAPNKQQPPKRQGAIPAVDQSLFHQNKNTSHVGNNKNIAANGSPLPDGGTPNIDWSQEISDMDDEDNVVLADDDLSQLDENVPLQAKKQLQFTQLLEDLQRQVDHAEKTKKRKRRNSEAAADPPMTPSGRQSEMKFDWEEDPGDMSIVDDGQGKKKVRRLVVELDNLVGSGGHGKVYKGTISDSGECVAVKKIPVKTGRLSKKFIKLEIDILRQISHKNLIRYLGCKYSSKLKEYSIVLEYADGGSLESVIKTKRRLTESTVSSVVLQALKGLHYLHSKKVIHRDLKPANILLTTQGLVKITDFGVSAQLLNMESMRTSCVGTPYYSAPEVIQVMPYSFQADIWSLGCSVFEMLFGHRPYHDLNQVAAMYRMVQDSHPPLPEDHKLSAECLSFLQACWITDWKQRPTAKELQKHPFLATASPEVII
jgi:hypothetical protein